MKLVKQSHTFDVQTVHDEKTATESKHGPLFPASIRSAIIGPSGCGKTNILLNLLYHPNGLKFLNVYIFSKTLYQDKYQQLQQILKSIPGMGFYGSEQAIPPLNSMKPDSIVIFDDVTTENQTEIKNIFSAGRHKKLDSFYLSQTYTAIPKHLLRDNMNFLVVFRQDLLNLKHIHSDHVGADLSFQEFQTMCSKSWENPHGFFVIAKDFEFNNGRYRKGFDTFFSGM